MPAYLNAIATHLPGTALPQEVLLETLLRHAQPSRRQTRLIRQVYRQSGIDQRHVVLPDFADPAVPFFFTGNGKPELSSPGTTERGELYARFAKPMFEQAGRSALEMAQVSPQQISHVITVSCTGFMAPGPDIHLVQTLGLSPDTRRYHLGFMGCYAAMPALDLARAICQADEAATVLIVCGELCSLHLQPQRDTDAILSGALFADGAAAALVSSRQTGWEVVDNYAGLVPDTGDAMSWSITNHGFAMSLSRYVPQLLAGDPEVALQPMLEAWDLSRERVAHWAIHPGGRAILDKLETALELGDDCLAASRAVLRECGNMSSPTVLHVLARQAAAQAPGEVVAALAFGPGLTLYATHLVRC